MPRAPLPSTNETPDDVAQATREELIAGLEMKTRRIGELEARLAGEERADEQLRSAEERYRVLLEVSPQIVWITDAEGRATSINEHWIAFCGRSRETMLGAGWREVIHRDDVAQIEEAFRRGVISGREIEMELRLLRADGVYRWFLARARPWREAEGRIAGFVGVSLDIHERRQTEQRLRESETRYRCATLATADLLWTNNAEGEMRGEQPGWGRFTGQTHAEYQGYGWAQAVHPEDAEPTIEAWKEAVARRGKFVFEHRVRRHDGEWRHCAARALPVLNDDGSIREWVGAHTDITEHKRAEAALRESEALFRSVFENTVLPIFLWIGERLTETNEAGLALLGYPLEEFRAGRVNWRRITPGGLADAEGLPSKYLQSGSRAAPFTTEFLGSGGQIIPVEIVATRIGDCPDRGIAFVTDISARQRAEAELLAKERHLRLALESTGLGTWESLPGFGCTDWSPRMREIIGAPADLAPSREWFMARLTAADIFVFVQALERAAHPDAGHFVLEQQILWPDGERRWVQMTGRGVFDDTPAGRVCVRVIGTVLDITEIKGSEARRQEALAAAERANAAKDEFLAKLSHELRTPLTPVLMAVSWMLEEGASETDQRADLEMIRRNVELEARLIDDLLDVTRIINGKLVLKRVVCDVHDAIRHALGVCASTLAARGIRVAPRLTAACAEVRGDPTRLQQIFWNLFNNGAKFAAENGLLEVTSEDTADGHLRICVRDDGAGIDPQHLPLLFEAFAQGSSAITHRFGGLGLGLAICRGILEMHGGRIWAESAGRGQGATFVVELPKDEAAAEILR